MNSTLLQVSGLDVRYGKKVAVSGAGVAVGESECVALIGTNGAGKSSLLKSIAGLQSRAGGSVRFAGEDAAGWDAAASVSRGLVLCPEGRQLFPRMTVFENVTLGAFRRRLSETAQKEQFSHLVELFPVIGERRRQHAGTLSGGEQQMVALARALMGAPRLLMLDEPSLGLSPIMTDKLFEAIGQIVQRGCSVLIAEQNVYATLKCSDRAYVVESGRVSASYTPEQIERDSRLLLSLLGQRGDERTENRASGGVCTA